MTAADKLKLKKEIEKEHANARGFSHEDLQSGRWFVRYLERRLASYAAAPTPSEVAARFKNAEGAEALVKAVINASVQDALAATDAYIEHLTSQEMKSLKDRKSGKGSESVLVGDSVALVAELLYTIYLDVHLIFQVAAAHGRVLNASQSDLIEEIFGRALGGFDVEKTKATGDLGIEIGRRIYERAILNCIGATLADAQRKGFYVYFAKSIATEFQKVVGSLPAWEAPKPLTGAMTSQADDTSFGS